MSEVLEVVRFGGAQGVAASAVAEAARSIDGWLSRQPGFRSRTLAGPDEAGRFTDIVRWRSEDDARSAADALNAEPTAVALMGMVDPASLEVVHLPVVAAN